MDTALLIGGMIGGTGIIGFLIGKIPDSALDKWIGKPVFVIFAGITHWANKITGGLWNKTVEPFAKKILNVIAINAFKGLDSDNNDKSKYGA